VARGLAATGAALRKGERSDGMLTFLEEEKKAADQSGRRRAQPVAQPNHAAVEHFVARESHAFDRGRTGVDVARAENTRSARASIDDRTDDKAEFVDQAGALERTVRLCLPRTKSGSIDDEVRRGSAERRVGRAVGPRRAKKLKRPTRHHAASR
jgi:hypothetical protein